MTPHAYVLSRETPELIDAVRQLGGAWAEGVRIWRVSGAPYALLAAESTESMLNRDPFTLICDGKRAVGIAVRHACQQLSDVQCQWHVAPELHDTVMPILLLDMKTVGGMQ